MGDWREEIIVPDATKLKDLKIFSTWIPTTHRFPWLMTDHVYEMSALNQNIGYNQPTQTGYYLGSDLKSDEEAWPTTGGTSGMEDIIFSLPVNGTNSDGTLYDLTGRRVIDPAPGLYIKVTGRKSEKVVIK